MWRIAHAVLFLLLLALPQAGAARFLSSDPVPADAQSGAGFNRYAYAESNPFRYADPDGRWAEDIFIGVPSLGLGAQNLYENARSGNIGAAIVDSIGIAYDAAAILAPGVPGGAGLGIRAGRMASDAATLAPDTLVYRIGEDWESSTRMSRKAGESEAVTGIHGLSASTNKHAIACVAATCGALRDAGFAVRATPSKSDPGHVTIELPKPVTKDVAKRLNETMGRSK